jgi:hypothetical protein
MKMSRNIRPVIIFQEWQVLPIESGLTLTSQVPRVPNWTDNNKVLKTEGPADGYASLSAGKSRP